MFFIGWLSFYALFSLKALRSPAPYAKAFARFCATLEKLSQNFCERYRYGALALQL
nr:hypothetical protein [uncultured Campylobacter sp.]